MDAADVVVAGAGPAGAAAAFVLAKAGVDVLLLERAKFPRDKSCGDGITAHAVDILNEMGVTFDAFAGRGVKTFGGLIGGPDGTTFAAHPPRSPAGTQYECWVVPRIVLDGEIANAAVRAGARLRQGVSVTGLLGAGKTIAGVECTNGNGVFNITAKLVIGADGAHSAVAKSLQADRTAEGHLGYALRGYYDNVSQLTDDLEIYYFERSLLPGYGWVFPTGPRTANVGVGIYLGELRRTKRKLRDILEHFIAGEPTVAPRLREAKQVGRAIGWPLPVSSAHRRTTFDGAMLCGDAASLVDPLTGEGIYTALVSGRSAAHAAMDALAAGDVTRRALRRHDTEWRSIAGGYLSSGRLLKNLAKSATLLNLIVRRARENNYYASRAIGYGLGTLDRRRALRSIVMRAVFNPTFFTSRRALS